MSDYIGVLTTKGQQKVAASIGGAALNLTTVRVGDGNGAAIVPAPGMIDLVRRVGAAYPIVASGCDPINATHWRVTALIPAADGPFDIREIGVFDAAGDMIAIARHVLVEKRSPAQGAAVELTTDIVFPVSDTAQVVVQIDLAAAVSIYQMLRPGFMSVESASLSAPPANPTVGATYVVGAAATGAWVGLTNRLAQWTGLIWTAVDAPQGFVVVAMDKAANDPARWLRRAVASWVSAVAATDAYGVARLASAEDIANAVAGPFIDPANLHTNNVAMAQAFDTALHQTRLAIEAEIPAPPDLTPYLKTADQRGAARGVIVEANQYKGVIATPALIGVSREMTEFERAAGAIAGGADTQNPYLGLTAYLALRARLDALDQKPTILNYTIAAGVSAWLSDDLTQYNLIDVWMTGVKCSWGTVSTPTLTAYHITVDGNLGNGAVNPAERLETSMWFSKQVAVNAGDGLPVDSQGSDALRMMRVLSSEDGTAPANSPWYVRPYSNMGTPLKFFGPKLRLTPNSGTFTRGTVKLICYK